MRHVSVLGLSFSQKLCVSQTVVIGIKFKVKSAKLIHFN